MTGMLGNSSNRHTQFAAAISNTMRCSPTSRFGVPWLRRDLALSATHSICDALSIFREEGSCRSSGTLCVAVGSGHWGGLASCDVACVLCTSVGSIGCSVGNTGARSKSLDDAVGVRAEVVVCESMVGLSFLFSTIVLSMSTIVLWHSLSELASLLLRQWFISLERGDVCDRALVLVTALCCA